MNNLIAVLVGCLLIGCIDLFLPRAYKTHVDILAIDNRHNCTCLDETGVPYMRPGFSETILMEVNFKGNRTWVIAEPDIRFLHADSAEVEVFQGRITGLVHYIYGKRPL